MSASTLIRDTPTGEDTRGYPEGAPTGEQAARQGEPIYLAQCPTGEEVRIWRRAPKIDEWLFRTGWPGGTAEPDEAAAWAGRQLFAWALTLARLLAQEHLHRVFHQAPHVVAPEPPRAADPPAAPAPAARLRALSGLGAGRLAEVFDVTRQTFQKWVAGGTPKGTREERLLAVLALVEEAARRLGSPAATRQWLLTPVSAQGKRPLDYLRDGHYDLVRGFLLRVPTGRERARPLAAPVRPRRPLAPPEREELDLLRPRLWREDDGAPAPAGDRGHA